MKFSVFVLAALISLLPGPVLAWTTPQQALSSFLDFESTGGRLNSWDFHKYLDVGPEYDEPGWDMLVLIDGYKIDSLICPQEKSCKASVRFRISSTAKISSVGIAPNVASKDELYEFSVVRVDKGWLLKPFEQYPHVLKSVYLKRSH